MSDFDQKAYAREVIRRQQEMLNDVTLNDIKCSSNTNNIKCSTSDVSDKKSDFISKDKYIKMLQTLESWNVMKPKSLTFTYGVETCYRMFEYVLNTPNVSNKGAYFRAVLKKCA